MNTETKTYSDGTVATGPAPLPLLSPAQQDAAGQVAKFMGLDDEGFACYSGVQL